MRAFKYIFSNRIDKQPILDAAKGFKAGASVSGTIAYTAGAKTFLGSAALGKGMCTIGLGAMTATPVGWVVGSGISIAAASVIVSKKLGKNRADKMNSTIEKCAKLDDDKGNGIVSALNTIKEAII